MADVTMKKGDRLPLLSGTMTLNGAAVNLTGATVTFRMRRVGTGASQVNAAATVTNAAAGRVQYAWAAGDTDVPGLYRGEWVASFAGLAQTHPGDTYLVIEILDTL